MAQQKMITKPSMPLLCVFSVALLLLTSCKSEARENTPTALTTSALFSDHMVLQRNQNIAVWGWCKPDSKIAVSLNGQTVNSVTNADGAWKVFLKPMKAGGPYVMNISSGKDHIQYKDVMLGEVWICSGQSNMEFELRNAEGYQAEQKIATEVPVRQFFVSKNMSLEHEKNIEGGKWAKADANSVGSFTAVGYFFAKELAAKLHVTVGIVNSTYGGTQAECWISKNALLTSPELKAAASAQPDNWDGITKKVDKLVRSYAYNNQPVVNYTADQLAKERASFFNTWRTGIASTWKWQTLWGPFRGTGFMQRTINVDQQYVNMPSTLQLGQTDADLIIYINGKQVLKGNLPADHELNLPAGTWKAGENSLVIDLLSDQKNPSWFGLGLNGTAKDVNLSFGAYTINMFDNKWRLMADFSKPYHIEVMPDNTVSTLYNGMVSPLTGLSISGIAWYQGESNADRAHEYRSVFPLLIKDWRNAWHKNVPFVFVQLPSWGPPTDSNKGSMWAEQREAQTYALKLPNTAMAVTIDQGDPVNLHYTRKQPVGNRLAITAFNSVYHLPGYSLSPQFKSADFNPGYALISFTNIEAGLAVKDNSGEIRGFEIAGADHKFYPAQALLINNKVKVSSPSVPIPVAVRYAWADTFLSDNFYNKQGLPVAPFRTDDWKGITDGNKFPVY